jgi:hypothetical protein
MVAVRVMSVENIVGVENFFCSVYHAFDCFTYAVDCSACCTSYSVDYIGGCGTHNG